MVFLFFCGLFVVYLLSVSVLMVVIVVVFIKECCVLFM